MGIVTKGLVHLLQGKMGFEGENDEQYSFLVGDCFVWCDFRNSSIFIILEVIFGGWNLRI